MLDLKGEKKMKKYATPELNIDEFDFMDILTNSGDGRCYAWDEGEELFLGKS